MGSKPAYDTNCEFCLGAGARAKRWKRTVSSFASGAGVTNHIPIAVGILLSSHAENVAEKGTSMLTFQSKPKINATVILSIGSREKIGSLVGYG